MAALSDQLLVVAILAYLAAMVLHAAEYAFGDRSHVGRAAARAGSASWSAPAGGPPVARSRRRRRSPRRAGRPTGPALRRLGRGRGRHGHRASLAHLGTLVTRGLAAERMPWGNMYEFVLVGDARRRASPGWSLLSPAPGAAPPRPVRHAGRWCCCSASPAWCSTPTVGAAGAGAELVLVRDPRVGRGASRPASSCSASCRPRCS